MSQPLSCPPRHSSLPGQTHCYSCENTSLPCGGGVARRWNPTGQQHPELSDKPIICPPGTYKNTEEGPACLVCPLGLCVCTFVPVCVCVCVWPVCVCVSDTILSSPGHYCVGGSAVWCPAGSYGPKEGLQRLGDCPPCPAGRSTPPHPNLLVSLELHQNTEQHDVLEINGDT